MPPPQKNVGPCICLRHIRCVTVQRVPGTGAMHGMSIAMDDWLRGWAGAACGEPDTPVAAVAAVAAAAAVTAVMVVMW